MSDLIKTMRLLLFRLWNNHADAVAEEGHRRQSTGENASRSYTAGYRDGYFTAVADLVREGAIAGMPATECNTVSMATNQESVH